jgi:DNA-binding NarL/FixJ family response regulator
VRVVIADDNLIVRDGLAALLREAGVEVAAQVGSVDDLMREVERCDPDVAIVDVRMPPTHTDEGLRAAHAIRARHPGVGILILSQFLEVGAVNRLVAQSAEGLGYLLKDRLTELADFVDTLHRLAAGGSAIDPKVLADLLNSAPARGPLDALTQREREVLALVAEGRTNHGIAQRMVITEGSVQKYVTAIFSKLGLPAGDEDHRRVLSVLTYLGTEARPRGSSPARIGGD